MTEHQLDILTGIAAMGEPMCQFPVELVLPFPPQTNNMYTVARGRKILSSDARAYKEEAGWKLKGQFTGNPIQHRVRVTMVLYPPCRRRRDIDNHIKIVFDSITAAGIWIDDEQVDCLTVTRGEVIKGGRCWVRIEPMQKPLEVIA